MGCCLCDILGLLIDIEFLFGTFIQQLVLLKRAFAFTLGRIFFRSVRIDNRFFFDRLGVRIIDWPLGTQNGLFCDLLSRCDIKRWLERFFLA